MVSDLVGPIRGLCAVALIFTFVPQPGSAQEGKPSPIAGGTPASQAERLVQDQVEAYNSHDLEAFLKWYSPEVKLYEFPDKLISSGLEPMREQYGRLFRRAPDVKVEITKRIVQGDTVIDHESGIANGRKFSAVAIYRVKDGKIVAVWFIK
jgi:hypothetical protein